MKLTNVKYCYRRDLDRWLIIFPTHAEAKAFEGFYSDGKYKPKFCTYTKTITETTRYRAIYAKLTGRFEQLRQLYRAKGMRDTIVDDLELDGTFDKIDLIFDTERGFATFRIEKFETWTDWACKSILNSQFGMVAQANGYYDTDDAYQGGLCVRRSCCGIGFDPNTYKTSKERIMFSVKDHCPNGKADIIKVSAWTNTFIGTNKENEKEYSWSDFKHYMGLLHANGSDIWDIEWEYDETCPMTGTEIADELHLYLKPEAYKRLFEEKEEPKQILKNITDISSCMTKVLGCDKMDPEKGIAMCIMKKFIGTNETHSNYLDFAKDAIAEYEKQQAAEKAKKKAEADKRRRAAAKKKGTAAKRGAKAKTEPEGAEPERTEPEIKEES